MSYILQSITSHTVIYAIHEYPGFLSVITIIGLFILIFGFRTCLKHNTIRNRNRILGSGLLAFITGLLVFPFGYLQMIEVFKAAQSPDSPGLSIVVEGFYVPFVPFLYGLLWFIISLMFLLFLNRRSNVVE